jgi:uncharacterized protein YndB with AHSA1/START domain
MVETKFVVDKEKLEVRISRLFNATPERLWKAFTDPVELAQWWRNTTIEENDVRVGGQWRYIDHGKNGGENHAFRGEFKEIDEPHKIVRTFEYEPWAGKIITESVEFKPQANGKTLMVNTSKFDKLEDLEGMVKSGMETGATAGVERIAKLVESKE